MQTLNVGAGLSDSEYQAANEKRTTELRNDSLNDAKLFFVAAGVAALGTGLMPIRLNILVNIGVVDLLKFYGRSFGSSYPILILGTEALWIAVLLVLGVFAKRGQRWAFWAGIVMYSVDAIALLVTLSIWAFGVHSFFLFKWYEGQKAIAEAQGNAE